ncbi:MOXD1 2 protein [Blattella germanica]|nr:MOXD1 2 protein [Blattella germanica]
MLHGYENGTHTVIRFRRRYDTCDSEDYRITNDTTRVLYSYHVTKTELEGSLPYHGPHHRGSRPLYLFDRMNLQERIREDDTFIWELKNSATVGSTVISGKSDRRAIESLKSLNDIFRLPNLKSKHHMIRYEALASSSSLHITYIVVYECQGNGTEMETLVRVKGRVCHQPSVLPILSDHCNNMGFNFPPEAGYPLDPMAGPKYFMMETHYAIPPQDVENWENTGIRVYYTASLREHDAGVLSVGLDPNWRHIIPPGQPDVVSEGHCISACTEHSIPPTGITMFAVTFHTHQIGRKVRLRHLRKGIELPPISQDNKYYYNYQEYRRLLKPAVIHKGDHLIAECVYNSEGRSTITLGGLTSREEMCLVFGYYFPRIELSLCHSLPSLPTGTEDMEEFYPNISHRYREPSSCSTSRWKKPRRRKKPGDEHSREMYNSISVHESSRLNNVACNWPPSIVLLLTVLLLLS